MSQNKNLNKDDILTLVPSIRVLVQDLLISFPKSGSSSAKSPRHQEMLKIAVENAALEFLHEQLWTLIQRFHCDEDKKMHKHLVMLWRKWFTVETLGLEEKWSVPWSAALVELSAVDMRYLTVNNSIFYQVFCFKVYFNL